ncbi:MAG TPA: hypothetical protein VGP72_07490 [Planctomycetota bacterium]
MAVIGLLLFGCVALHAGETANALIEPIGPLPLTLDTNQLASIPARLFLPAANLAQPKLAEAAKPKAAALRASADLPMPAWQLGLAKINPCPPPQTPLARVPSPEAERIVPPWSPTTPDPAIAERTSDPAEAQAYGRLMSLLPQLRQTVAPFAKLIVPDPLELTKLLGMKTQTTDATPPVQALSKPARPVLPTKK